MRSVVQIRFIYCAIVSFILLCFIASPSLQQHGYIEKGQKIRKEVLTNCNDYLLGHTNSHRHVNMIINELTIKIVNKLMGNNIAMY